MAKSLFLHGLIVLTALIVSTPSQAATAVRVLSTDDQGITLANDSSRPETLRNAASWWLRQGGAVLD